MARVDIFRERLVKLWEAWDSGNEVKFQNVDAIAIATGVFEADAEIGYLKSFALVTWLFGAELQGCAIVLSKKKVLIIIAKEYLKELSVLSSSAKDKLPDVEIISASDSASSKKAVGDVLTGSSKVGILTKEAGQQEGEVAKLVNEAAKARGETQNIAPALAQVLAVKDMDEISKTRKASYLTANVIKHALIERIERTIDQEKKTSHLALCDTAEDAIVAPAKVRLSKLKADFCDPCYPPIIQSNDVKAKRKFDLRPSAESSNDNLKFGCIVVSVGARYNFYCSNASRTLLVQPSEMQEKVYGVVLKAQEKAIAALVPGAPIRDAYMAAKKSLMEAQSRDKSLPNLASALMKNVGFGMGIEFRDSALVLNAKNETTVKSNMVFNVSIGVQNVEDKENGTYAVLIADTVIVREAKLGPEIFTSAARKDFKHISYIVNDDDEDEVTPVVENTRKNRRANGDGLENGREERGRSRRRAATDVAEQSHTEEEAMKLKKHQEDLAEKMLLRAQARLAGRAPTDESELEEKRKKQLDEFRAYSSATQFPQLRPRIITVDMDAEAIIVPINGIPVPFHISVIKSVSKSDEGQYTYLRINFFTPHNPGIGKKGLQRVASNTPEFPNVESSAKGRAAYMKEVSFRSSNPGNLSDCMRKIKELRKRLTQKETQAIEMQTLVAQQSLVPERRQKVSVLHEVLVRPAPGKRNSRGALEAHTNGFRFRSRTGSLDIIYSNIRNAFFQPAENQVIVIIHFHLKNEIMVGKKKTKDLQFYVQVVEAAVKLSDKRRRQFDQDELEEEQRERDLKNRTNKMFSKFTREVNERYQIEFDIPYRELAFEGAPKSSAVTLVPTVSCIVDLIDNPPFILNLGDVEIAHFERVNFQLRMFDLVFVFKGFEDDLSALGKTVKDMWTRISSIRMEELIPLKNYLDRQNIKFYEGPANLQWNEVLKNIRGDLEDFYKDGGWKFLSLEADGDEGSDDEDEDESDDGDAEFRLDSDAEVGSDQSSDYSDSDASGAIDELGGDSDAGEDELSSDEEGKDWEDLDMEAEAFDRKKGREDKNLDSDNEDRRKGKGKRKRTPASQDKRKRRR